MADHLAERFKPFSKITSASVFDPSVPRLPSIGSEFYFIIIIKG